MKDNEPTQLQRDRMRLETRYLTVTIAIFHAIYILNLVSNKALPYIHEDYGATLLFILLILVNIHLYDESKCYHYCFWHRQPIIFSLYYETSRILWDLKIIQWSVSTWNTIDEIVLCVCFFSWLIGYNLKRLLYRFRSKDQ